ncbi:hypothetical protein TWF192_008719 [Orbilia oligospora]|nr:hypothetical protein TWF192_008719 [Orbilia oligospora]
MLIPCDGMPVCHIGLEQQDARPTRTRFRPHYRGSWHTAATLTLLHDIDISSRVFLVGRRDSEVEKKKNMFAKKMFPSFEITRNLSMY